MSAGDFSLPASCIQGVAGDAGWWAVAVQWHPELSAATDPLQQRLFDALVKAAREV